MRLGSRDPLHPDDPSDPKAPRPLASGIVARRNPPPPKMPAPSTPKPPGSAGVAPAPKARQKGVTPEVGGTPALPGRDEPALALIESASIAVGFQVADEIVKKAPVRLLRAQTASPGKFIILYAGDVASVEEAHRAGLAAASDTLLDELLLPHAHHTVLPALEALTALATLDSFAVIETFSFAAAIVAADTAVKAAPVALIEVRPPVGLGGKSFLTLTGGLEDLQSAVGTALDRIRPGGMICRHVLIPNPHGDLLPFVF